MPGKGKMDDSRNEIYKYTSNDVNYVMNVHFCSVYFVYIYIIYYGRVTVKIIRN
jgi:hypothetical protein